MTAIVENQSFAQAHAAFCANELAASEQFATLRAEGVDTFNRLGWPTRRLEAWRYTNLNALQKKSFVWGGDTTSAAPDTDLLKDLNARVVTMTNGVLDSVPRNLPKGVTVCSLADGAHLVSQVLGELTHDEDAFTALNGAFLGAGLVVHIAQGVEVQEPIHVIWQSDGDTDDRVTHPRLVVAMEACSKLNLIESYIATGDAPYLNNVVSEISVGPGAHLEHAKLQLESTTASHLAQAYVEQGRDSSYTAHLFHFGANIGRASIHVRLLEPGANCYLGGLYMVGGKQHADVHTRVEHVAPHCESHEVYRGILDGSATSVFNGYVLVRKEAQKTNSSQQNRNLLLSKNATANTRPQLEIYADDVKCAHGATVGQLDADQLFYMQARGISLDQARTELTFGFAADSLEKVSSAPVQAFVEDRVRSTLLTRL